jgi:hypothetical protein
MKKHIWVGLALIGLTTVTLYGAAVYPSGVKSFPVRTNGQTIVQGWFNELQDEVVAIENGLISGIGHTVKPLTDAAYDLGSSSLSWRDGWFSRNVDIEGTLAVDGLSTLASASVTTAAIPTMTGATTFTSATPIILSNAAGGVRERGRAFQMGEMQSVTYADSNFLGDTTDANWVVASGDQGVFAYTYVGKRESVALTIITSTVANTPAELRVTIPGGTLAANSAGGAFYYQDNGTAGIGRWYVDFGGAIIHLVKVTGTWANSTDLTVIQADMNFEVQ